LMVKDTNDKWKVKRLECTRLEILMTQFRLTKNPFDENICIWGKEIQIWMSKDSMRISEDLINFIEDLITRKINFLESIWVLIGRNWRLGDEIGLWKA
jgi:uncharacterized membrane protein (DUF106 family)